MNYSLSKVWQCPGIPLTGKWTITDEAKKSSHITVIHIDRKTITVWLFHKQVENTNVGFPHIFACGKACLSSICHILHHQWHNTPHGLDLMLWLLPLEYICACAYKHILAPLLTNMSQDVLNSIYRELRLIHKDALKRAHALMHMHPEILLPTHKEVGTT